MFLVNMRCESTHKSHCLACNDSPHTASSNSCFLSLLTVLSNKFVWSVVVGDCARLGDISVSSSTANGHMVRSCAPREFRDTAAFRKCVLNRRWHTVRNNIMLRILISCEHRYVASMCLMTLSLAASWRWSTVSNSWRPARKQTSTWRM